MGNFLRRKRPPSAELDELVFQIRELEVQLNQLLNGRTSALRWVACSALLIIGVFIAFFWLQHGSIRRRIVIITSIVIGGLLVFLCLRCLIISIYDWFIHNKQRRIQFFTDKKLAIIEEVKENETYNVARELIKKYGKEITDFEEQANANTSIVEKMGRSSLKNEQLIAGADEISVKSNSEIPKLYEITHQTSNRPVTSFRTPIRPFVEQSHTPVDRILDFVMGESINNRYALICSNCRSHNGMALKEEFEHISFFCFKCNFFNRSYNEIKMQSTRLNSNPYDFQNYMCHGENTDDSTENEEVSERRLSSISLHSDAEHSLTGKNEGVSQQ